MVDQHHPSWIAFGFESKSFSSLWFASRKLHVWKALPVVCLEGFRFSTAISLSPGSKSQLCVRFRTISHLNRQRRSKCLDGHAAGSVGMWKGDGSLCNDDIFSTISALWCVLAVCRDSMKAASKCSLLCVSCGMIRRSSLSVRGWEEHFVMSQCLRRSYQKPCAKIQYLSLAMYSLPFACFEVMPG